MRIWQEAGSRGFTLIESMLALSLLAVVVALIPLWVQSVAEPEAAHYKDPQEHIDRLDPMEVELFFQQMQMEIRESDKIKITKDPLQMVLEKFKGSTITIQRYKKTQIRRLGGGTGHIMMLYNVAQCHFHQSGQQIKISVTGKKGHTYERTFISYKSLT